MEERDRGCTLQLLHVEDELEPARIGRRGLRRVVPVRVPASGAPAPATGREGEREGFGVCGTPLPHLEVKVWDWDWDRKT